MKNNLIIAKKIREFRLLAGIKNQTTLGVLALGYPEKEKRAAQQKIKKFELGKQEPKASELRNIAALLDVRMADFFIEWTDPHAESRLKKMKENGRFPHIKGP